MFSMTTMASSIRMPIDTTGHQRQHVEREAHQQHHDEHEITDTGSASDVIAVAFQSLRNSMTMSTVSSAPSSARDES